MEAYRRVVRNAGAAGIDGVTVDELWTYCQTHWPSVRAQLLDGSYRPSPVRQVLIPKAGGGRRPLGIPTVLDRLIQQALVQVLTRSSSRRSRAIATASARGGVPMMRSSVPVSTSQRAIDGPSISIWRSSSIE
jgi:retron-type reverse transcriptase